MCDCSLNRKLKVSRRGRKDSRDVKQVKTLSTGEIREYTHGYDKPRDNIKTNIDFGPTIITRGYT